MSNKIITGGGTEYLLRRRFELLKRKEDEEMSTWETLIDYTTTKELGKGSNDVERYDSTILEKLNNAKKIAIVCYLAPPSTEQSAVGIINVQLYLPNKYYVLANLTGDINTLPNKISGNDSEGYIYREIDIEPLQSVGIKGSYPIYAPTIATTKDSYQHKKLDAYWFNDSNIVDATALRLNVKSGVLGKGSRFRVLILS